MVNSSVYASSNIMRINNVCQLIDELQSELNSMSGKCIDIDCGSGDITKNILLPSLGQNVEIIGTDSSQSMVEYANNTYGTNEILKFEVLDIQTKNLPEKYIGEFDHVFSFPALYIRNDIQQEFENIYKMLRPGGTFLMLLVSFHDTFEIFEMMTEDKRFVSHLYKYISPFRNLVQPHNKLKELLRNIGFRIRHCSHREMSCIHKNSGAFLSAIISGLPSLDEMPPDRKEDFQSEFIREYAKRKCNYTHNCQRIMMDLFKILIVSAER